MSAGESAVDILRHRAAVLAERPDADDEHGQRIEVTVLEVAGARCAVRTRHVRRVVRNDRVARLPASASLLVGAVTDGGEVVPVADLAAVLEIGRADLRRPFTIVLGAENARLGLLVDAVIEVTTWHAADVRVVRQASPHGGDLNLGPDDAVVLDGDDLLEDPRFTVHPTDDENPHRDTLEKESRQA
jgi:chemotaxis signal transduction protein